MFINVLILVKKLKEFLNIELRAMGIRNIVGSQIRAHRS